MEKIICDICGGKTSSDSIRTIEVYYGDGMKLENHCFYCNPPEEDLN
jgi:hypothetical protein